MTLLLGLMISIILFLWFLLSFRTALIEFSLSCACLNINLLISSKLIYTALIYVLVRAYFKALKLNAIEDYAKNANNQVSSFAYFFTFDFFLNVTLIIFVCIHFTEDRRLADLLTKLNLKFLLFRLRLKLSMHFEQHYIFNVL